MQTGKDRKCTVPAAVIDHDDLIALDEGFHDRRDFTDQRFDVFFLVVNGNDYGQIHRLRSENR